MRLVTGQPAAGVDFIALIPARLASTRLPDKPLAEIGGRPMVVRVAERAARSGASRVAVATDSEQIAQVVRAAGFEAILTRADHPTGTDRLAEATQLMALDETSIVVNVQGDEPLIPPSLVAAVAARLVASPDCSIATAAHAISDRADYLNPNVVKVVTDRRGRALYFSRAPIPWERGANWLSPEPSGQPVSTGLAGAGLPLRHVGLYAYRVGFLRRFPRLEPAAIERLESLEQLRALWHGEAIAVHETNEPPPGGVDTAEDLERVRAAWQHAAST